MLIDAMKSAGPKMIVSTRGDAVAIALTFDQAQRVLDLRLDPDLPDLVAHGLLDLGEQQVQRDDLLGRLHLRQHDRVEVRTGALDDLGDVAVGPLGGPVVDAHHAEPVAPAALVQRRHDRLAGAGLGQRGARVLEVEEDLVGGQGPGLVDELLAGPRYRQAGPAGTGDGGAHGRLLVGEGTGVGAGPTMLTRRPEARHLP